MVLESAVHESLGVPLNRGERRTQLVGDVDDEILPDALELFELTVLAFQLLDGALEIFAGLLELRAEQSELARVGGIEPGAIVSLSKLAGEGDDAAEPLRDAPREEGGDHDGRQKRRGGRGQHAAPNRVDLARYLGERHGKA